MNPDQLDPAEALALADRSRSRLAERDLSPAWYAPVYGLGVAVMVAAPGLRPQLTPLATAAGLAIVIGAYAVWSRRTGVAVTGFRAGRTRVIAFALLAVVLGLSGAGLWLEHEAGLPWGPLATGALAGVAAAVGSRMWDAAWLAELRGGR